ncbi:WXG100 family type VII secretion target [Amycolatopsis sp. NPDC051758]|uniref:WXG100 family type VII secretion target n=1 Tax=Amycolatopsis sp. NPDC051758 TaxID=3363935 RepID=UPI00379FDD6C
MADKKKWSDVKALLDDPSVPAAQKSALISSWLRENPPPPPFLADQEPDDIKQKRQEAEKYAGAYNANPLFAGQSVDEAFDKAKSSGDQNSYNEDQEKKAVDDGKAKLDGAKPPASADGGGSTGTKTSDEIFDAAAPALKLFETFGSLLAKIPADCRGNTRALDLDKDIRTPFDEQRGISFEHFVQDAAHFKTGSETVDRTVEDTGSQLGSLYKTWSGAGADAASDTYNDKIQPKAAKLSQTLGNVSEATLSTATTVFQLCKGKADAVVGMYTDLVGKADYTMAQKVIAVASGEHGNEQDLAQIAGWMDLNFGTNLVKTLNDQGCCDGDEIKKHGQDLAKQWIQNQFNPDMWDRLYQGFVKTCKDTKDLVDQAYDALDKVMGAVKNEFEGVSLPGGSGSGTGGPGAPGGSGGGPGGSGSGSGSGTGAPGGGSGSGSGAPGGGSGSGAGAPGGGSGSGGGGGPVPNIPEGGSGSGSGVPGGGAGGGSGSDLPSGSGGSGAGGVPTPSVPDLPTGSGGGSGSGSGSGAGGGSMPSIPDLSTGSGDSGGSGLGSGGSGSGSGGGSGSGSGGDDTAPSSVPSPSASGQEAAAAAAEEAKKKATDALNQFSGPGIETESGAGSGAGEGLGGGSGSGGAPGLGDTGSGSGSGSGGGSGSGSGSGSGDDGKAAAEQAAEEAKQKAADALKEFSGPGIETEPGGSGLDGGTGGDKDGDGKPDSLPGGDKDGDGKPDSPLGEDKDGDGKPDDLLGADKDGDGKPDSLLGDDKDGDDTPDTLKVKQGDKTFEMTEPDHDGKMDIKVGDGSGPLKDFKLDWSDDAKAGDGPQGTDDVHCPGPDGKIHIEDGGVKITAERPDGPTVVTVDDGSGTPTTYTLGEDDKDGPKHLLDDTLGGDDRKDVLGDTPSSPAHSLKTDDLPTHSGTLDGIGAGGGGGGGHGLSAAGLDPVGAGAGAGVGVASGGGLGEAPSLSEGVHSGVGAHQQQPVTAGFAPSAAGAPGATGQSMGGGMAPMGGMGGGGAGGGDQERTNRAYRIEGAVFEPMAEPTGRIMGSLDDEEPPVIRRR